MPAAPRRFVFREVVILISSMRVGVFVDAENVRYNGGYQMRYDVLRRFAARESGTLQRLNTYLAFDLERAREDQEYAKKIARLSANGA
jgi:hypothetical protein